MDATRYADWVERYVRAWNTNDPRDIEGLFRSDGRYLTEPYVTPWTGHEEIVAGWIEQKDEPGDTEFDYDVLVATEDLGIVKGRTLYKSTGHEYVNLWEIKLDEAGLCSEFVEWWMKVKS
jgi:SnoaL-like domain